MVVSYRNSTSNHNTGLITGAIGQVVSYRNSTSNHNIPDSYITSSDVVSYRNSTSNHNSTIPQLAIASLYLIEILHQTTTDRCSVPDRCSLYLIEILHQTTTQRPARRSRCRCILSKFYIKPQRRASY